MNERIEHCLYQAGLTAQGCWDELDDYTKKGIEKFAELLIDDIAQKLKHIQVWDTNLGEYIKQQYGFDK